MKEFRRYMNEIDQIHHDTKDENFRVTEQNKQYEKTLQKGINLLKNNPNAIIEIIQVANRLSYLRGRLFEQNKQTEMKNQHIKSEEKEA